MVATFAVLTAVTMQSAVSWDCFYPDISSHILDQTMSHPKRHISSHIIVFSCSFKVNNTSVTESLFPPAMLESLTYSLCKKKKIFCSFLSRRPAGQMSHNQLFCNEITTILDTITMQIYWLKCIHYCNEHKFSHQQNSLLCTVTTNSPHRISLYSLIVATCFGVLHVIIRELHTKIQNVAVLIVLH